MRIEVRVFAALREAFGAERLTVDLPPGSTGADLRARLAELHPRWSDLIRISRLACGVEFVNDAEPLSDATEVVLIPPVSGGAPGPAAALPAVALVSDALDPAALSRAAYRPGAGAVVSFTGTVRSPSEGRTVEFLQYEAYEEMALEAMRRAVEEARARWPLAAAFLHHRLGRVKAGESSVVAVVSAPHRAEAFDACRFLIERLKKDIPIWKQEVTEQGSAWVGTPPPDPEG